MKICKNIVFCLLVSGTVLVYSQSDSEREKIKKEMVIKENEIGALVFSVPGAKAIIQEIDSLYKQINAKKSPEVLNLERQMNELFRQRCITKLSPEFKRLDAEINILVRKRDAENIQDEAVAAASELQKQIEKMIEQQSKLLLKMCFSNQ